MINICVIGASTGWTPTLVTDLMMVFPDPLEIRLNDIETRQMDLSGAYCERLSQHLGRKDRIRKCRNRREALKGADAVIITISTGGLDAMEHDLNIPEKYGIFATVGDTAGPGGWSRSIRNIPVFQAFAADISKYCPQAFIANYTNPMASLTATLQLLCPNPSVGLCHAYFETKDVLQKIFGLPNWDKISMSFAGMNHFTWVVDFKIGHEDGYTLLRKKIGNGSLRKVLPKESADEIGFFSGHELCVELFDAFGYLPYPGDRHTCEFISFVLCGSGKGPQRYKLKNRFGFNMETFRYYNIKRTSVAQRRPSMADREQMLKDFLSGKRPINPHKSRETGAEMVRAYLNNKPMTDAVNVLNIGQIPGLPLGACVETMGMVDGFGVRPVTVARIPEHLLEVMRPQAICQKWITQGVLEGNKNLLLQALYRDPQCAHLKPQEIRRMGDELIEANQRYAPVKL
ncbi:MAG: hypothetical protein WC975_12185 [Phycisphaerae bacterium]